MNGSYTKTQEGNGVNNFNLDCFILDEYDTEFPDNEKVKK